MTTRHRCRRALAVVVAGLLLAGCEGDPGPLLPTDPGTPGVEQPPNTRIVGFVGTLSGPQKWRGEDAFEGADLAVHHLNRARVPGSPAYDLRPLDDGGDAQVATQLVEQLAELSSTVGIVYAGPPEGLPAAAPALARAGVPALLCYGDLPDGRQPHLFQMSPPADAQARRIVSYLATDRRYRTVGALLERSAGHGAALASLRRAARQAGLQLAVARFRTGARRFALRRLRARRVEALVLPGDAGAFKRTLDVLRRWGATYTTTAAARTLSRRSGGGRGGRSRPWRPQPVGFDLAVSPRTAGSPAGAIASDSYLRGAHYLPVPSLRRFRASFFAWWGSSPTGWEQRAFDAVSAIGWAAGRAAEGDDLAAALEGLARTRFAGPVSFGPADHVATDASTVGMWAVPRAGARVPERARPGFRSFPWVPLARTFVAPGGRWRIAPGDRRYLTGGAGTARPLFTRLHFGVRSPRSDPVH